MKKISGWVLSFARISLTVVAFFIIGTYLVMRPPKISDATLMSVFRSNNNSNVLTIELYIKDNRSIPNTLEEVYLALSNDEPPRHPEGATFEVEKISDDTCIYTAKYKDEVLERTFQLMRDGTVEITPEDAVEER